MLPGLDGGEGETDGNRWVELMVATMVVTGGDVEDERECLSQ